MLVGMAAVALIEDGEELAEGVGLRPRMRAFVAAYVANGGNGAAAAREAGYVDENAAAFRLVRLPHVLAAMKLEQRRYLQGDLMALALQTVRGILADPDAPKGVKATLALGVLDRGGLPAVRNAEVPKDAKSLEEMSIAELEEFIRRKEAEAPDAKAAPDVAPQRRQVIENEPIAPPSQGGARDDEPAAPGSEPAAS